MSQDIIEAIDKLKKWLVTSGKVEKEKKIKKIEYSNTFFTDDGIKCITMRFKIGMFGKWLLGITCDTGSYSDMQLFNKATEIEDAKKMIGILKEVFKELVEKPNSEDNNNDFLSNIQ